MYKSILLPCILFILTQPIFSQSWERLDDNLDLPNQLTYYRYSKTPPMLESKGFLFLATSGGIYRSSNLGRSWEYKSQGLNNPNSNKIMSMTKLGNEIYILSQNFELFKTNNDGDRWEFILSLIYIGDKDYPPYSAQLLTVNDELYLATDWGYGGGELYISKTGLNWKAAGDSSLFIVNPYLQVTSEHMMIDGYDSLLISSNQGFDTIPARFEWSRFNYNMSGTGNYFHFFSKTYDSIYYSKDGLNWLFQKLTTPFKVNDQHYFSRNKIYSYNNDEIFILQEKNGVWQDSTIVKIPFGEISNLYDADSGLFAIASGHVYFLGNNNKEWVQRDSKIHAQNASTINKFKNLLYKTDLDKFRYSYDGQNWKESLSKTSAPIQSIKVSNSENFIFMQVLVADTSYLYKSTNGIDWIKENIGVYKYGFVSIKSANQFVYIKVNKYSYPSSSSNYFSNDGGNTFKSVTFPDPEQVVSTKTKVLQKHISFPYEFSNFLTSDDGIEWDTIIRNTANYANIIGSQQYFYNWPSDFDIYRNNRPFVLLRSSDGEIWVEAKREGLPQNDNFYAITAVKDLLFASLKSGGLFMSKDFGDNWESIQTNLPQEIVGKIYMLEQELFLGTEYHGLWKTYANTLSVERDTKQVDQLILYPNPATSAIIMKGIASENIVSIYNLSAQLVQVHSGSEQINIAALPAGLYFAKVQSGDKNLSGKFIKK